MPNVSSNVVNSQTGYIYIDLFVKGQTHSRLTAKVLNVYHSMTEPSLHVLLAKSNGELSQHAHLSLPHVETRGVRAEIVVTGLHTSRSTFELKLGDRDLVQQAIALCDEALPILRAKRGNDHPTVFTILTLKESAERSLAVS